MQGLESQPEEFGPFSFCQSTFIKYLLQTRCCGRCRELKIGSNPHPLGQEGNSYNRFVISALKEVRIWCPRGEKEVQRRQRVKGWKVISSWCVERSKAWQVRYGKCVLGKMGGGQRSSSALCAVQAMVSQWGLYLLFNPKKEFELY